MKKSIIISMIILMIIALLGGVVNASSAGISASSSKVTIGDTVKVTVSFGDKVSAAQFTLNYDSSIYEYVSKSQGGSFSASTKKFAYANSDGEADLASVTFTFKAKVANSTNFSINALKISTAAQDKFTPSISKGSVTVTAEKKEEPTPTPDPTPTPMPDPTPQPTPAPKPNTNTNTTKNTVNNNTTKNTINTVNNTVNNVVKNEVATNEIIDNTVDANEINTNEIEDQNQIISTEADTETKGSMLDYLTYIIIGVLAIVIIVVIIIIIKRRNELVK